MRFVSRLFILSILALTSSWAVAGTDPVSWSLNRSFQNPSIVGRTYTVIYTVTSHLPFRMAKALVINKSASPSNEFTYDDQCSGQRLNSGGSCTVSITLTPSVAGTKSVQLTITGYDNNQVLVPALITSAQGTSPSSSPVSANVTESLPANLTVGNASSYQITFKNNGDSDVGSVSVAVTQTSGTPAFDSNCDVTLKAGKSCYVTGSYTPASSSPVTQGVNATLSYSGTASVSASTSGSVTSSSGVVASLVVPYLLPAEMAGGTSQVIQVKFLNNTGGDITATARDLSITTGSGSATFTIDTTTAGNDNCLLSHSTGSKTLPNGGACVITGTLDTSSVGSDTQVVVTGTLTFTGASGSPSSIATSTYLVPSLTTSRTITLQNNCNFPVWFSLHGGSLGGASCSNGVGCPPGSSCNGTTCYWDNPAPNTGSSYKLDATSGNNTVTIPLHSGSDPAIQWSGVISASLRCDSGLADCMVAPCGNADGATACAVGQGFKGPTTQAEITFNIATSDSYDVEVINGFHIPVAITPGSHTVPDNYTCGVAGNFTATNNFGSCNWNNAVVPGNGYYIVTSGGDACNISAPHCSVSDEVCGIALDLTTDSVIQSCGDFLGFWTANEVCGLNPAKGSAVDTYFNCSKSLGGVFPSGSTYYDLMKCAVPTGDTNAPFNTCYYPYASSTPADKTLIAQCCGCVDWWTSAGGTLGANPNTASCTQSSGYTNTDPTWNSKIQPTVQWLKKTCPSAYVYQFDDKTSGFSCSNNLPGAANSTSYTITFCQGTTGKPSSTADGRIPPI